MDNEPSRVVYALPDRYGLRSAYLSVSQCIRTARQMVPNDIED